MTLPSGEAALVLEDGTAYFGAACGALGERGAELVFNTAMAGYQEILTDPSYAGQGVVMTYPQIGNYGVNPQDDESARCWAEMFIVRQLAPRPSSHRATQSLGDYLRERGVPAIENIDTRHLTLKLREMGALRAILSTECSDPAVLAERARRHTPLEGRDLVMDVSCRAPYRWSEGLDGAPPAPGALPIACYDYGIKRSILRCLVSSGFAPTVVPARFPVAEVLALRPAGVFLSNGPGDPAVLGYAHETVRAIAAAGVPIFGICLGHQIIALAFGGRTVKMKFGHHGANHPVIETATGHIAITAQNHSFMVDPESLSGTGLEVTHVNGNDGAVEGLRHRELPVFSVQYHPEAAPGPHESRDLFQRFRRLIDETRGAALRVSAAG